MTPTLLRCLPLVFAAACIGGCDDPTKGPTPDAATPLPDAASPNPDATPGTAVAAVPCPAGGATAEVWYYEGMGYVGATATISVGQIVRFYNLGNHTADHASGLWSASGDAELCIRFDGPGAYAFRCYFHSQEQGAITVQ